MQPIIKTDQHRDLYNFLAALADTSYTHFSEPKLAGKTHDTNTVIIWSPEAHSELLDSIGKLEIVERHAQNLGLKIVLSAASNQQLRSWGNQVGWVVLWEMPGLDHANNSLPQDYSFEEQTLEPIAQLAC